MSTTVKEAPLEGTVITEEEISLVDKACVAVRLTPEDTTKQLLQVFTEQALTGTLSWNHNLTKSVGLAVEAIDKKISQQLSQIMHQKNFQKLEGTWRGLNKLVKNSDLGTDLKIKILNADRETLLDQFENATAIDRSPYFNMVYQSEYGTAGGEPYSVLLGDYEFGYGDEDVALMRYLCEVSAASHAPFVAAASPAMFDFDNFTTFYEGKPVAPGFDAPAYAAWNSLRDSDESRYMVLTMPRVMSRAPYGKNGLSTKSFHFEELPLDGYGDPYPASANDFTWTNACFSMGQRITDAFSMFGWCTAIRGLENGGKVDGLPTFTYRSASGDKVMQCPTEINLTDEREKELSDLGFLPLVHYKNQGYAVFIGAQTIQRPKQYIDPDATANAAISARMPYIMASSRIAHYLKVIGRDRIGSNVEAGDLSREMNIWIQQYTNANAIGNEARATHPLREAKIDVKEQLGRPGCYSAVAYLRPWLQMEELTTSLRMVANIPGGGS
ncbi:type VI secretion system contractile sheath large subunit [Endozoicomonadaceae bacterium StTr2]